MFDHSRKIASIQDDAAKPMLWAPGPAVSGCRLSLDRTRAVSTADLTGKSVIYVVPHLDDTIECWSGEDWVPRRVPYDFGAEQTRNVLALDISGCASATVHDVYLRWVGSTPELKWAPWNHVAARFAPLNVPDIHPDGLGLFQGRFVQAMNGDASAKGAGIRPDWLYLGSFYTSAAGQCEDSGARRYLWNMFQREPRAFKRMETTVSWTYGTSAWRQANASSANQVACVTGLTQVAFAQVLATAYEPGADSSVGIGVDSTTPHADGFLHYGSTNYGIGHVATLRHAALGYRTYTWCELRVSGGTVTYFGTATYGGNNYTQCGLSGEVWA